MSAPPHVVILGGGFAGMGAVQKLGDAEVRITLIDRNDYHTFQPLLYQVATAELGPEEVAYPLRELQRRHHHLTLHTDDVVTIDLPNKKVTTRGLGDVDYDYLVIALGSVVNFFGTEGAADHAFPLYTMPDALRVKNHLLKTFEAVDRQPALADDGALNVCIVGGGPTGVEMAGALADLIFVEFRKDYPSVPIDKAQVLLYEHAPSLLRMFKPELQAYAMEELTQRGVKVQTGCGVTKIGPDSITLSSGEVVKTQTLIWAAGLEANPVTATLGVELVRGGRIPVGSDLQVQGYPGVFAVGDIAAMTDGKTGEVLPGLGATALQAGKHVGTAISDLVLGDTPAPFKYLDKGSMAQVGRGAAIAELPTGGTMTGHVAWMAWLGVHLALLNGVEERASTVVDWGWNFVTHGRSKRLMFEKDE
jgi:NADH dehydrogenase